VTYEEFVDSRLGALARYAVMLTGDRHTAQDLVQETRPAQLAPVARADAPEHYVKRMMQYLDWRRGSWLSRVFLRADPGEALAVPVDHAQRAINATYHFGGARGTREAVERLTGARVDAVAEVRFSAMRSLTDALGGVPVCLPAPVTSQHTGELSLLGLAQRLDRVEVAGIVGSASRRSTRSTSTARCFEQLDPEVAPQLLAALRADTLDVFAGAHPDWVLQE
jgi:hypothetical protein